MSTIGSDLPRAVLEVGPSLSYSTVNSANVPAGGTITNLSTRFYVSGNQAATGMVGINTSNPQNILNVIGDINATGPLYSEGQNITAFNATGLIQDWNATGQIGAK